MLVGAVMGFWACSGVEGPARRRARRSPFSSAALAGAAMALIHAFLVITLRANQIVSGLALTIFAGGLGLSSYLGNDLGLADVPATHQFERRSTSFGLGDLPIVGPIVFDQTCARVRVVGAASLLVGALPRAHAARASTSARSASRRRRPTRWGSTSRCTATSHVLVGGAFAGVGGACFSLVDHAAVGRRRLTRRRRRLDRDRARHLRVLARRALPRRRVPLRGALGAAVRAAGARRHDHAGVPPGAAVRDDDRRARARLDRARQAAARRTGRARRPVRARGAVDADGRPHAPHRSTRRCA